MGKPHPNELIFSHHLPHKQHVQWGVCCSPSLITYGFVDYPCNIHEKTRTHHCKRNRWCRNTNDIIDLHHNYEVVDENISLLRKFIKRLHGL
jgi:hypothetical protein